jgi:hypothetical protein
VHGFVGKRSENPNSAPRASPGIFVGHADDTPGYLVYHEDTDTVVTYGYVTAFPRVFPCKERMMSGEDPATLVSGDWRRWADFRIADVADGPLSEFVTGKQLEVRFPQSMYPTFSGQWRATCQRPISLKNGPKAVCMRMIFSGYTGDILKLSKKDQECLSSGSDLWVDIPISPQKKSALSKDINGNVNLRELLATSYPNALLMHEFANESVRAKGKYPVSSIVRTAQEDLEEDTDEDLFSLDLPPKVKSKTARIIVGKLVSVTKSVTVGQSIPRITLKTPYRFRAAPVRAPVVNAFSAQGGIDFYGNLPPESPASPKSDWDHHVGFEPENLKHAKSHSTWTKKSKDY